VHAAEVAELRQEEAAGRAPGGTCNDADSRPGEVTKVRIILPRTALGQQ
jgi:hypothetical protein